MFHGFEYKKNCIRKLYIKMFIKRKTRVGKAYAYRMLLSLKMSVTDKKKIFLQLYFHGKTKLYILQFQK